MKSFAPPRPPGWNKSLSEMLDEWVRGERAHVAFPESEWAREYEREQFPEGTHFPRKGDVYEALEDMPVRYMTAWAAPFTGGGDGFLRKGERVVVDHSPHDPRPIAVYTRAVDYEALEQRMVPASDRNSPRYGGFYFCFKTLELNQKFRFVKERATPPPRQRTKS